LRRASSRAAAAHSAADLPITGRRQDISAGGRFRSYRGNVETTLRNVADVNAGWVDELIGHDSPIRRSEGARYTKSIFMANLKRTIDKITISADLTKLYYTGQHGVCAPGTAEEIVRYTPFQRFIVASTRSDVAGSGEDESA
jgi:hypothetical protein